VPVNAEDSPESACACNCTQIKDEENPPAPETNQSSTALAVHYSVSE
jgi:hypothetical protein